MESGEVEHLLVVPLHNHPEFVEPCALLLNDEWKKSLQTRIEMLEKSSDNLPLSIILVEKASDGTLVRVVGHARLLSVPGRPEGCFLEAVVIDKACRGKGYGRLLMEGAENHARRKGFSEMYLSAQDARTFYEKLGYEYCSPVATVATAGLFASWYNSSLMEKLLSGIATANQNIVSLLGDNGDNVNHALVESVPEPPLNGPPPPPPPPGPPPRTAAQNTKGTVHYMRKHL
ncbi:N-alpha-acetyltransferase 80-like [Paramacrobiotus metropolitanus]|uniref:N-alpha-acetyltransferase 80-like n=1 Tax=Paramacrobiotus metropolitanus TaxID=2943436 RepID=UPI002445EACB|nr:N-alpha-acetyltransferase 80-like [Paramacrobiotus metropolitanus]